MKSKPKAKVAAKKKTAVKKKSGYVVPKTPTKPMPGPAIGANGGELGMQNGIERAY